MMAAPGGRFTAALAIARRDLVEFVRDRRTLFVTLLLPMVTYPIVALSSALGLRTAVSDLEAKAATSTLAVAVSGAEAQPFVVRMRAVAETPPTAGPAAADWPATLEIEALQDGVAAGALLTGVADVWVEAGAGTLAALDGDGTATVSARLSPSRDADPGAERHWEALVRAVSADALRRRAAAAGLPDGFLEPLRVTIVDAPGTVVATASIGPTLAASVLVLLAVLTLTGAFYPAIDAIAGEKERGTIETLLMAPCSTGQIVLGKFLAVFVVTLATLAANVLSIALTASAAVRMLPAGMSMALADLGGGSLVTLVAFIGLAALAAATCLAVTTASKSGKEAQNTLTPVILLVSALAGTAMLPGLRGNPWLSLVPFAGQIVVSRAALVGPDADGGAALPVVALLGLTLLSALTLTWILLKGTAVMLTDEDILFRGPDAAPRGLARPARRKVPSVAQGAIPVVAGLALVWYLQGLAPGDLRLSIPLHQGIAVILPLVVMLAWQRVDTRTTLGLSFPARGPRGAVTLVGAGLIGAGLFFLSAALLLALGGGDGSPAVRDLTRRLLDLLGNTPWWLSAVLMVLLPAVAEETLYRGWVLAAFAGVSPSRGRAVAAVAAQAVLFALAHLLPERMPATFALGLVTGALRVLTGSILPSIVLHAVHNAVPLVLVAMAGGPGGEQLAEIATGGATRLPPAVVAAAALAVVVGAGLVGSAAMARERRNGSAPGR
jgi:sodium transport system permease protein